VGTSKAPAVLARETGTFVAGGVASLAADDNSVLSTMPMALSASWRGVVTGVPRTITRLTISFRGRAASGTCVRSISIWNDATKAWVQVETGTLGTTETAVQVDPAAPASRYVDPWGGVSLRVKCAGSATFDADLLRITYS
jgi:hypothetical protein